MSGPKSLVLVTVDCLRADHTGFMGYTQPTTPFLDRLAAESMVFPKAIVAGAPTFYSFPGLMASRFPLALGREVVGIAPGEPTIASVLRQAGYRTAAYVSANPYLSNRFGYAQGFDVFEDFLSDESARSAQEQASPESKPRLQTRLNRLIAEVSHRAGPLGRVYDDLYFEYQQRVAAPKIDRWTDLGSGPSAEVLVNRASEWLGSLGRQPFFLWLHFMDAHAPYYPPAESLAAMGAEHISPERGRYLNAAWSREDLGADRLRKYRDEIVCLHDAGIRWVDTQLARLADGLRSLSLWDSTLFVQTADHGEEFLDHGGSFHFPSRAYQELLHVPLLMRVPGVQRQPLTDAPFSHVHLAPTVLDAMGIDSPPEFEGRSYWTDLLRGGGWEWAVSESIGSAYPVTIENRMKGRMLIMQDRRYKLVLDFEYQQESLFDLESDPRELHALPQEVEAPVRARLLGWGLRHLNRPERGLKRELAIRARLREVGLEWKNSKMNPKILAS